MQGEEFGKVSRWIKNRQSIFPSCMTGNKVSDELILSILENANAAPSHRNTEPWRFKIVTPKSLSSFSDFSQVAYKNYYKGEDFIERKFKKIKTKINKSSHVLIICMQRDLTESVREWEELAAVSCAIQNIYLSLASAGLGGYWSTPEYLMENIGSYVKLNVQETCLGFFYIGEPLDSLPPPIEKRPITSKIEWL